MALWQAPNVLTRLRARLASEGARAAAALAAAWATFFAGQLSSGDVPWFRDNILTYLPLRQYLHQRLLSGELPQWYPDEALGVPLIGQIAVGTFHPATWLLLPLHFADAVRLNLLLSYLAASAGAYLFARAAGCARSASVGGALAFAYGGYALGVSSLLPYAMSFAALPFVGWALWRLAQRPSARVAAALAAAWALVFLAGDPQGLLLSVALLPAALVQRGTDWPRRWRALLWVGAAGVVAGLLVGVELVPAQASFADSLRVRGAAAPDLGTFWALSPARLAELLVPGPSPWRGPAPVFITTVFAGGCALALAAAALAAQPRRALPLAALGLLALWLALGDAGGLLPVLQRAVPPLGRFRYPEKYVAFFWVPLGPLVALGLDAVRLRPAQARWTALPLLGLAAAALAGAAPLATATAAAALVGLGAIAWLSRTRPAAIHLVPLLVFAELWNGNGAYLPLAERGLLEQQNPFALAVLAARPEPAAPAPRVIPELPYRLEDPTLVRTEDAARDLLGLYPVSAGLAGVTSLAPRLGALSTRYDLLIGAAGARARQHGPWVNACFRVGAAPAPGDLAVVAEVAPAGALLARRPCRPAAYLAGAEPAAGRQDALTWLAAHSPDAKAVVWEGGPALAPAAGTVRWLSRAPERLALEVDATRAAALVVADAFAPGWTATVDGHPAPIYPALLAVRGVPVPEGRHHVELAYRTPGLGLGAACSGAGLLGLLVLALGRRRGVGPA